MERDKFARDIVMLLFGVVLLTSYSFFGRIYWYMSLSYLLIYIWYFVPIPIDSFIGYVVYTDTGSISYLGSMQLQQAEEGTGTGSTAEDKIASLEVPTAFQPMEIESLDPATCAKSDFAGPFAFLSLDDFRRVVRETYQEAPLAETGGALAKSFHWLLGAHFELMLKFSIPPAGPRNWDRFLAATFPVFGTVLTLVQFRVTDVRTWEFSLAGATIVSMLVSALTSATKPPRFMVLFMLVGFLQSVQWMWFLCNISVDAFKLFVEISGVRPAYVGLTFLACANSIGDLISDLAMARMGYSVMALTAAFAGPIFNLMMGVGITMTRSIFERFGSDLRENKIAEDRWSSASLRPSENEARTR